MSTVADVLAFHLHPRKVVRRRLVETTGEGQALLYLMVACILFFVAQLPELVRVDLRSTNDVPFNGVAAGRFVGGAIFAPLAFYLISAIVTVFLRVVGVKVEWLDSRIALFWALLAIAPAALVLGMLRGLTDSDAVILPATRVVGSGFLMFWFIGLYEAPKGKR